MPLFRYKITTCENLRHGTQYCFVEFDDKNTSAGGRMTKSELIETILSRQSQLSSKDVELAVKTILEHMSQALSNGERIEIRGFGSFSLHFREPRRGRNPKTGDSVELTGKFVPHFKPGKELRERVNLGLQMEH
jgi:integration host factor subunit beta